MKGVGFIAIVCVVVAAGTKVEVTYPKDWVELRGGEDDLWQRVRSQQRRILRPGLRRRLGPSSRHGGLQVAGYRGHFTRAVNKASKCFTVMPGEGWLHNNLLSSNFTSTATVVVEDFSTLFPFNIKWH